MKQPKMRDGLVAKLMSELKGRTNSISFQVTIFSFLGTFVVLIGTWFVLYGMLTKTLAAQDWGVMQERVKTISTLLQSNQADPAFLKARVEKEWAGREYDRFFVRIFRQPSAELRAANGAILPSIGVKAEMVTETPMTSDHLQDRVLAELEGPSAEAGQIQRQVARNIMLSKPSELFMGDEFYRISTATVVVEVSGEVQKYRIEVAMNRTSEATLLAAYRATLFFVIIIGFFVSSLIAWVTLRNAVDPIASISRTAAKVNSEMLGQRLALETLPIEFHHLATTFNAMLDRLEQSFDRLARFSEDMAHELRTPVGNILGAFEVGVSRPRTTEEYEKLLFLGIEESDRLKRIIESLLFIARSSAPIDPSRLQPLNLDIELEEIVGFYEALAQESGMTIDLEILGQVRAPLERTLVQRAVGNLISNSIRYGGKSTRVTVRLSRVELSSAVDDHQGSFAKVEVNDEGEGIADSDLLRVGERFFRTDRSRSKISGGTGLGLSIVKGIMTAHRGFFEIKSQHNVGTSVTLLFPIESA